MADTSLKPLENRTFRDFIKSADSKMILKKGGNLYNMDNTAITYNMCNRCFLCPELSHYSSGCQVVSHSYLCGGVQMNIV